MNMLDYMAKKNYSCRWNCQLALRLREYTGLLGWVQCSDRILKNGRRNQRWHHEEDLAQLSFLPNIAGFETGRRGPGAKEGRQPLEAGKAKETDAPLELLERNVVLPKH